MLPSLSDEASWCPGAAGDELRVGRSGSDHPEYGWLRVAVDRAPLERLRRLREVLHASVPKQPKQPCVPEHRNTGTSRVRGSRPTHASKSGYRLFHYRGSRSPVLTIYRLPYSSRCSKNLRVRVAIWKRKRSPLDRYGSRELSVFATTPLDEEPAQGRSHRTCAGLTSRWVSSNIQRRVA